MRGKSYGGLSREEFEDVPAADAVTNALCFILNGSREHEVPSATPRLVKVIPSPRDSQNGYLDLKDSIPFLLTPSVNEWVGHNYQCISHDDNFAWPTAISSDSAIEDLTLGRMCVKNDILDEFFSRFSMLRILRWHEAFVSNQSGSNTWDAGKFVQALSRAPFSSTLQSLSISMGFISGQHIQFAVNNFRYFAALRNLEIHIRCFTGGYLPDSDSSSVSADPRLMEYARGVDEIVGETFDERTNFVDMFPETLTRLTLLVTASIVTDKPHAGKLHDYIVFNAAIAAKLIVGFGDWRRRILPDLRALTIAGRPPKDPEARKLFNDSLAAIRRETKLAGVNFTRDNKIIIVEHVDEWTKNLYLAEDY